MLGESLKESIWSAGTQMLLKCLAPSSLPSVSAVVTSDLTSEFFFWAWMKPPAPRSASWALPEAMASMAML